MGTFYLETIPQQIRDIMQATFPEYSGRKVQLSTDIPHDLSSYWDGGSKTSYKFYHLDQGKVYTVESNHPYFESDKPRHLSVLPARVIIVAHCIFCGKDLGLTIHANGSDLNPILPAPTELPINQRIVLLATRCFKSSYAGQSNMRYHEAHRTTGISLESWDKAKAELIQGGYLNKAGAITTSGKNAVSGKWDLYGLKAE